MPPAVCYISKCLLLFVISLNVPLVHTEEFAFDNAQSGIKLLLSWSVPPRINGQKEQEVSVIDGHMVSLLCDVQAYPPPEITWTRDGQLLHFTTGIHILPGQKCAITHCHKVLIHSVPPSDSCCIFMLKAFQH